LQVLQQSSKRCENGVASKKMSLYNTCGKLWQRQRQTQQPQRSGLFDVATATTNTTLCNKVSPSKDLVVWGVSHKKLKEICHKYLDL